MEKIALRDLSALYSRTGCSTCDLEFGGEKKYPQLGARGGKGGKGEQSICGKNGAGCREGRQRGMALIGVSANPWVHHLQI